MPVEDEDGHDGAQQQLEDLQPYKREYMRLIKARIQIRDARQFEDDEDR